jgi:hypothetical protein
VTIPSFSSRALPISHWHFHRSYVLSKKLLGPLLGGEVASRDTIPVERWQNLGETSRCPLAAGSRDFCAGKGMYYDKAFEQMQKMGGGNVVAIPEPTKVDCLNNLHFK